MIQSMTGYGRGSATYNDVTVLSEIRSLNSKITDLRIKLPVSLGEKEIDLRNLVLQRTQRGKIEMTISFEGDMAMDDIDYDKALIRKHFKQLSSIATELGVGADQVLHEVLKLPKRSLSLRLLQKIRDESHRFAITYHRKLRKKSSGY